VVDYLETDEDMALYLEACYEDKNPELFQAALGDVARALVKRQQAVQKNQQIPENTVNQLLSSKEAPDVLNFLRVLKTFGLELRYKAPMV